MNNGRLEYRSEKRQWIGPRVADNAKFLGQQEIEIANLIPHPDNPNRGDVDALAESLLEFGQFRSIIAQPDGTILAGHHLVQAAKQLGIKTMRVDVIEADEKTARKIMLSDNRLADLGPGPDIDMLLHNLEILEGDISGTGFDEDYIRMLEEAIKGPPELDDLMDEVNEIAAKPEDFYRRLTIMVEPKDATRWESHKKLFSDDNEAFHYLLAAVRSSTDETKE